MRKNIRRAPPAFAVKALSALIAAAAFGSASAAGLGKLTVLSALGQPLRAEIELTSVSREEADTLVARLASSQAFKQANIDFSPALMSLRFAVEQRGARQIIRISSSQPVNEPYVGMLVELASSKGRLVREYTFLLDPPELRQTQTASIAAPVIASKLSDVAQEVPASEKHPVSERSSSPRKAQKAAKKSADADEKTAEGKGEYQVRRGDTLGSIAGRHKSQDVSLDQMLVSIYRANPDAFIDSNMNRLKSGRVITIPDAATASGISQSEARKIIIAQSSDFDQYRNKLASTVAQTPPQQVEQTTQAASGQITAKVDEQPSPANKSVDRLKLSKENAGATAPGKTAGVVSTEDKLSQDKSVADAQARIRELEKNIKELQGILELRSKEMAAQQKQADTAAAAKQSDPAAAAKPADATAPVAQAPAPAPAPTPQPASEAKPKPKPKLVTPPPPPPSSFLDDLLDNTTILGAIAAAVLGVGYLVWNSIRRKKKAQEITDKFLAEPNTETPPNSLFGSTGGQSINTNNSIFNSSFTPSASQLDANEVDPVAEADVYIAYGREAQAIEILKDALRTHPERNAVRVKLLEIYASQSDVLSFDALASDMYALTKGEGEDWAYVAKMGASIDPKNPLYTDGDLLEEAADKPASLHAMTNPIEALDPDSLTAPSRLDMESATPEPAVQLAELAAVDSVVANPETALWADLPLDISGFDAQPAAEIRNLPEEPKLEDLAVQAPAADKPDMLQDLPFEQVEIPAPAAPEPAKKEAELEFESMIEFDLSPVNPAEATEEKRESIELTSMPIVEEIVAEPLRPDSEEEPVFGEQEQAVAQAQAQSEVMEESGAVPQVSAAEVPTLNTPFLDLLNESQPVIAAESVPEAAPLEFDFSSINLDLGMPAADLGERKEVPLINIEMATKLDLAVAYKEIGDKEGARELLEEVIKGGTDEQVAKAKETLAKLG